MYFNKINYDNIEELSRKMKSIFTYSTYYTSANLSNLTNGFDDAQHFWLMSEAYFDSSEIIINECLKDNSDNKADRLVFPILFDIIHGIELSVKAIICNLNLIINNKPLFEKNHHNIKQLVSTAISMLHRVDAHEGNNYFCEALTAMKLVKRFVDNIYERTNDMTFARYPLSSDNKDMFYANYENQVYIDMALLQEQLYYIVCMLGYTFWLVADYWQNENNIRNDYQL